VADLIRGPGLQPSVNLIRNTEAGASDPPPVPDTSGYVSPKLTVPAVPLTAPEPDIHRKIMAAQALAGQAMNLARCLVNQLRGDDPWRADKTRDALCNLLAEIGAFAETNKCEDALKHIIERMEECQSSE
jgi:hypothetical protein